MQGLTVLNVNGGSEGNGSAKVVHSAPERGRKEEEWLVG